MSLADGGGGDRDDNGSSRERDADSNKRAASENHNQQHLIAGLHRDGEQARIVEVIRRRQMQQRDENYYTFEYMWGSVLYYSGFVDEHPSSSFQINDAQFNGGETENSLLDSNSTDEQKLTPTPRPIVGEGPIREEEFAELVAKRPFVVRVLFKFYHRIHLMLRWFIDTCITRLSRIESLPQSPSMYATNPTYSLHFQADDIVCFIVILWASLWISSRTSQLSALTIIMFCIVIGSVGTRVVGRVGPAAEQLRSNSSSSTSSSRPNVQIPAAGQKEENSKSIERLQRRHPNATKAECIRFFRCTKRDERAASVRIDEWLAWRRENGLSLSCDEAADNSIEETIPYSHEYMKADEELWNETAKVAMQTMSKSSGSNNGAESNVQLPQIICSYEVHKTAAATCCEKNPPRCKDGTRIFHLVPARFDLSIATAQVYALVAALYLDRLLSRSSTEKVSLICDVRGGRGWANPTPWSLLPFVQATSSLLGRHFPERLKRMVLYPMPSSAVWVWAAAQKFLDADTASKVVVVGLDGASSNNNGMHEELKKFITKKDYLRLEERRKSFFASKK